MSKTPEIRKGDAVIVTFADGREVPGKAIRRFGRGRFVSVLIGGVGFDCVVSDVRRAR